MKRDTILLAIVVLFVVTFLMFDVPGLTPVIPIRSQATVAINTSSSGNTLLVSHVGSQVMRFSYHLMASGTTTVSFVYGTTVSTSCDTGTTTIDGTYDLIAQTGMTGVDLVIPTGNDLCVDNSAAVHIGGALSYINHNQ
jgi:hypothetical protein